MVITHNVSLINAVCSQIWIIENCTVKPFPGAFLEYLTLTLTRTRTRTPNPNPHP